MNTSVQVSTPYNVLSPCSDLSYPGQALASTGASIQKLLSISSVVLERQVVDYNLQLSILLKGARGIGKFTAASLVSRHLGLHILEVSISLPVGPVAEILLGKLL